ncbi:DUF1524 domain-containing protein [Allosaccharopolyspora coralli]|uniref:DUF1524 domain-containing protein n=1 Tax=Allosaccharopolyspora coralli TaxID=2665642 RepID=A0A5Q3QBP3_9PSEU|nr:HNH endonuclease family protein [Allosaccharopolyspora coralli]QGK71793.1 DUF1524 domain-containing protein [Allosaccharopolyspora coralli]
MTLTRSLRSTFTALPLAGLLAVGLATPADALPPGIPSADQAETMLSELTVAPEGSMDGYDRDRFPHWNSTSGGCDVRDEVLKRDGENIEVGENCDVTGTWNSAYDPGEWTDASDVDIDHVVPLAAAWRSGAADWSSDEQRSAFANDLESPQLIAVTDNVNQEKGDKPPQDWMPPNADFHCTYAAMWVGSKHKWELTVSDAEKAKLTEVLGGC